MSNQLILKDRRGEPWGKVDVRLFWQGGGQDKFWVNDRGVGEFGGSGIVSHITVAGEQIGVGQKVDGNSSIVVMSRSAH